MKSYTAIIRQSRMEYVALCLELNVSARGDDIANVEKNLRAAIELYLEDIRNFPETKIQPTPAEELIEFFQDTAPEWPKDQCEGIILRSLAVHEVRAYA